jgi:hypothetical protein
VSGFWAFLYYLAHLTVGCVAITQSTHSTPATEYPVVYAGNCVQAFLVALQSAGSIAWETLGYARPW